MAVNLRLNVLRSLVRRYSAETASKGASSGHVENAGETAAMWAKIFIFVAVPANVLGALNVYLKEKEEATKERPEFRPYEHVRIRTKRYPWGDGTRTFFHNPHVNALPTGYEAEAHH